MICNAGHEYHTRTCAKCRRLRRQGATAARGPKSHEPFLLRDHGLIDRLADEDREIDQAVRAYRESRT